jgi:hypothetical protein
VPFSLTGSQFRPKTPVDGHVVTGWQTMFHYRMVEKLVGGGIGVVYKAENIELDCFAALKFLPEDLAQDSRALERPENEAELRETWGAATPCLIPEW